MSQHERPQHATKTYEYRCHKCSKRETYDGDLGAAKAGWTLVQLTAAAKVKYIVVCPAHRPEWIEAALAWAGAKKG